MREIATGQNNDKYRINEILGNKFQQFIERIKNDNGYYNRYI